jgi:hypothetical protein
MMNYSAVSIALLLITTLVASSTQFAEADVKFSRTMLNIKKQQQHKQQQSKSGGLRRSSSSSSSSITSSSSQTQQRQRHLQIVAENDFVVKRACDDGPDDEFDDEDIGTLDDLDLVELEIDCNVYMLPCEDYESPDVDDCFVVCDEGQSPTNDGCVDYEYLKIEN